MSNIRKTQRKNKTNQVINWPPVNEYFTIDSLTKSNPHMLTSSGSDITLRVRLMNAVKEEPKTVSAIGTLNLGKGRPQLAFAMIPVSQEALDKAAANKVILAKESELISVVKIENKAPAVIIQPVKVTNTLPVNA